MGNYTAESNHRPATRKTQAGKSLSVVKWVRGIRAGRLEKRINFYYDNISKLNPDALPDYIDPAKLSTLGQLTELHKLQNILEQHANTTANSESPESSPTTESGDE